MIPEFDPFAHHPALRETIADPLLSFFRTFSPDSIDALALTSGFGDDWRYSDEKVESDRRDFVASHGPADLWVFGYGSLMWDPAFRFVEVRRARIDGYERRFCLLDQMARGSKDRPGLMAALDVGGFCEGLVFRIPRDLVDEETGYIWRRELFAPPYKPLMVDIGTAHGKVQALAVVANRASEHICPDLTLVQQARFIGTGAGFLGTSRDYIEKIAAQLEVMCIKDQALLDLLAAVRAVATAG